ncbi:MAG: hypothetical protein Q7K29_03885 [Thermoleophilia bacterium]|nr:hypothetical protein [Thermoleophilia bacterium]
MDKTKNNKKVFRIRFLALAVIVCAWLLPTSAGIASTESGNMKVSLTVEDAIGVNYGRYALSSGPEASTEYGVIVITESHL